MACCESEYRNVVRFLRALKLKLGKVYGENASRAAAMNEYKMRVKNLEKKVGEE